MSLDGWMEIVKPCFDRHAWTYMYFIVFIGIGALALMNLVTAVVVESSVKKVREDRDYQKEHFIKDVAKRSKEIRDFWVDLQGGKSCRINIDIDNITLSKMEFLDKAMTHNFLKKHMNKLGMKSVQDYLYLFNVLDADGSDSLELREVVCGVLKLQQLVQDKDTVGVILAAGTEIERRLMFSRAMATVGNDVPTQLAIVEKLIEKIVQRLEINAEIINAGRKRKSLVQAEEIFKDRIDSKLQKLQAQAEGSEMPTQNHTNHYPDAQEPARSLGSAQGKPTESSPLNRETAQDQQPTAKANISTEKEVGPEEPGKSKLYMKSSTWKKCLEAQHAAHAEEERFFRNLVVQRRTELKSEMKLEIAALRRRLADACCQCCGSKTVETAAEHEQVESLEQRVCSPDFEKSLEQRVATLQPQRVCSPQTTSLQPNSTRAPIPLGIPSLCAWKLEDSGSKKEMSPRKKKECWNDDGPASIQAVGGGREACFEEKPLKNADSLESCG
eukprot:gnl/MRDRNA2_/MRDRNA2_71214_c0_seq1.p1 gnl/MRDRNA2_/MRDRNA2_71214_c0~~gnl/MRDRNA2_/MRDRNA2_71214_c0_seq1.p1  ORF type:complete len:583 (+),score=120.07 gnl/MRDRNA2_/MRDRNA2_71214_c0_seq1:254-1750(+)